MPLSAYGTEVFKILLGCIENDPACIDTWRENLAKYPKESAAFLSYLCKINNTDDTKRRTQLISYYYKL